MQPGGAHVCNGSCSANTLICSIDRCGFETHDIDSFHLQKSVLFLTPQNSPHPRSTEKWGSLTKPKKPFACGQRTMRVRHPSVTRATS